MEVENHLFVVENGLPRGQAIHFHVSSRECNEPQECLLVLPSKSKEPREPLLPRLSTLPPSELRSRGGARAGL